MQRIASVACLTLCAILCFVLLGKRDTSAAEVSVQAPVAPQVLGGTSGVWWVATGVCEGASIWLGPCVVLEDGSLQRQWTLTLSDPGSSEPLVCLQGLAATDDAEAFGYQGLNVELEVRPRDGRTWGTVRADTELDVRLNGLF